MGSLTIGHWNLPITVALVGWSGSLLDLFDSIYPHSLLESQAIVKWYLELSDRKLELLANH